MNRSLLRLAPWLGLGASCAAYLLLSLAHHQAFHPWGRLNYFDLRVYRGAGQIVLNGGNLYDAHIWRWAPFTYPPLAALLFTPLALLPLAVDELLVTLLGAVALLVILERALRLPVGADRRPAATPRSRPALVAVAVAAALWLEPITATLGYGQINLLIALLVVCDLSRPDGARGKGALIGIAAGLKLTPLIFVPYLFLSHRRRAAAVALSTFGASVAAGYALIGADAARFWGGMFLDPHRVGGCCIPANQSLRGVILRIDPSFGSGPVLAVAMIVAIVGVALAVLASRRGDEAMGFSLCAVTGLLVSPVSWSHHWTLAVPALGLMGLRAVQAHSAIALTAVGAVALVGYSYLPKLMGKPAVVPRHGLPVVWTVAAAPYVWLGLGALALACVAEARRHVPALHHVEVSSPRLRPGMRVEVPSP